MDSFSAGMWAAVIALKSVDLPTFGRPTMPQLNPILQRLPESEDCCNGVILSYLRQFFDLDLIEGVNAWPL